MKRSFYIWGALALLCLAACNKETGEAVTPSPYYDSKTNTVKTEFVLNVSTNTGKDTKTTAEFAQVNSDFLGMNEVHILSYALPYEKEGYGPFFFKPYYYDAEKETTTAVAATRDFSLGTLFGAKSVDEENASRSVELALPLGTNAVVLYGRALKSYSDDLQGKVKAEGNTADLMSLKFSLQSRLSSTAAFDAGAFFFTRMLTYFTSAGLVNEGTFWQGDPISADDNSYGFWWPIPASTAIETQLPSSPADGASATVGGVAYKYYAGELSWKQLGVMYQYEYDGLEATKSNEVAKTANKTAVTLSPLGEIMGDAYNKLTVINVASGLHEIRAGSASALLRTMQDLYSVIDRASNADPTSWQENIAKLLAKVIQNRMDKFFVMYDNGEIDFIQDANNVVDVATLKKLIPTCTTDTDWSKYKSSVNSLLDKDYFASATSEGFPINVGLPHGAAALICDVKTVIDSVDVFIYQDEIPAYGMGDVTFPISNYRYPAELMYVGNSPIRVTQKELKATDYPSSVALWNNEGRWSTWDSFSSVKSDTRSVAMVNNINYGTALLASTVKFGAETLKDNNHKLHPTEEDQSVPTTFSDPNEGFFVSGIIVGGQADIMGWDFVRFPTNSSFTGVSVDGTGKFSGLTFEGNAFDKMIYDKVTTSYKVGTTTEPIYTMLWDNYDHTKPANEQSDVFVGVELVNNTGMDLWGELNLIRKGGTFYLVGKLDLAAAVASARSGEGNEDNFTDLSRDYYCYPPFDPATGETISAPRVFMQDYMTKANLIIGPDALKHAYVTVPDLRSSQVSLGVSIDMKWESGLAFDVNLGN